VQIKQNKSSVTSNCTLSKCLCVFLSCGRALKYFPLVGCWGLTHCTLSLPQRLQNTMDEKGHRGNKPRNSKERNFSVSGCPATCWLSGRAAAPAARCENAGLLLPVLWESLVSQSHSHLQCFLFPRLLPFPLCLCASSFFLAPPIPPLPAAKVSIPGRGSFPASFSCYADPRPSKGMLAMTASPLQGNRTHKTGETEHYSSADVERKCYPSSSF